MQNILLAIMGLTFSVGVSAGLFAFISSIGIIQRMATKSKTSKYIMFYEDMIILGATLANAIYLLNLEIKIGLMGLCIIGLFFGIFVGVLAISLAETIKALPIYITRIKIIEGLPYIILAMALGKAIGSLYGLCY